MQDICDFILYPHDVFCPKSHATGIISITEQTVTIHHFSGSWQNKEGKISASIKRSMNGKGTLLRWILKTVMLTGILCWLKHCRPMGTVSVVCFGIGVLGYTIIYIFIMYLFVMKSDEKELILNLIKYKRMT